MFTSIKTSSHVKKLVFVILSMLVVVGGTWYLKGERVVDGHKPVITFPAVSISAIMKKDFDNNSVSLEISRFIADGAEQKTLWKLEYVDAEVFRTRGLELFYELDSGSYNLAEFYEKQLDVVKNNGWKLLAANLEDSRAFLDIQRKNPSADYKVRISVEQQGNQLNVKAQYLITLD